VVEGRGAGVEGRGAGVSSRGGGLVGREGREVLWGSMWFVRIPGFWAW
jgi:hypothetical protein